VDRRHPTPSALPCPKARQPAPDLAGLPLASGFTNLVASKRDGEIELDPHVDGGCRILLDEAGATVLRDVLVEWLGRAAGRTGELDSSER
jgi:hypothetical protein